MFEKFLFWEACPDRVIAKYRPGSLKLYHPIPMRVIAENFIKIGL